MKIGVVIPVLNQFKLALEALWSIRSIYDWQPFIIDNWRNSRSVSASWNQGIGEAIRANCDCILVINDDVVLSPWTIDKQVEYLKENQAGIILTTGWAIGDSNNDRAMLQWPKPSSDNAFVSGADFACFMIPRSTFQLVGLFDENFDPAYFEDNDYHRRLLLAGYKAEIVTTAPYLHYGSRTQKEGEVVSSERFEKNERYYIEKWGGKPGAEIYATPFNDPSLTIRDWTKR